MAAESLKRSASTTDSERKYQLISKNSIRLFADSRGHSVTDDVIRLLTEDVNYRLREIVSEAARYAIRSAHCCMRVSDVNHALADANVPLIYPGSYTDYTHIPSHKLYAPSDSIVDLTSVMTADLNPSPSPLFTHSTTNDLEPNTAAVVDDATKRTLSNYFTAITETVAGSDAELRKVALADVICNTRIGHIQHQLLLFIRRWANSCLKSERSVHQPLELLDALTSNKSLNFTNQQQVETITNMLVNNVCMGLSQADVGEQLSQQQYASYILTKCLHHGSNNCKQAKSDILARCEGIIRRSVNSFTPGPLIGALVIVKSLQPQVLLGLNTAIDSILALVCERKDMESSIVVSLLVDALNCILEQPDSVMSTHEQGGILTYAGILQRHLPEYCVCRLFSSAVNTQQEVYSRRKLRYLRRIMGGRPSKSTGNHSQHFTGFKLVPSSNRIKVNYGAVRASLKYRQLFLHKPLSTRKTIKHNSHGLYRKLETMKFGKVNKRSSQQIISSQSMLCITL